MNSMTRSVRFSLLALLVSGPGALAHHSFAMFDNSTELMQTGTVKEFQWSNPHSYIQLIADKDDQNWPIECGGSNDLMRQSWRRDSLKPGEKIAVHVRPLRNGAAGARLMRVEKAAGGTLGQMPEGATP